MTLPYDIRDANSIETYAKLLVDESLRSMLSNEDLEILMRNPANKGELGQLLERYYFKYEPNNRNEPDFQEAGLELKSTPVKPYVKGGQYHAKERLVLNVIDYMSEYERDWETSSFWHKNRSLLLVFFLYNKNLSLLDYIFKIVGVWTYPPEDLQIIQEDWNTIVQKIRDGKAHELSERDTFYMAACTKGAGHGGDLREQPRSEIRAKQRAFSFKPKYMNSIIKRWSGNLDETKVEPIVKDIRDLERAGSFEQLIAWKFEPYLGMTPREIEAKLGISLNSGAKSYHATLTLRILGVTTKKAEEFEKADVEIRTVRLNKSGMPEEDISFPYFHYKDLITEEWETSTVRTMFDRKFFFVLFQKDNADVLRLRNVMFWTMPYDDLEVEVKKVWDRTISQIKKGKADELPKKSETKVCHVRPHGRDGDDTDETPDGQLLVKKCFWLNAGYIKQQVSKDI